MPFQRLTKPKIAMGPFGTIAGKLANSSWMMQHIKEQVEGMKFFFFQFLIQTTMCTYKSTDTDAQIFYMYTQQVREDEQDVTSLQFYPFFLEIQRI
jgi:hypothetical protein